MNLFQPRSTSRLSGRWSFATCIAGLILAFISVPEAGAVPATPTNMTASLSKFSTDTTGFKIDWNIGAGDQTGVEIWITVTDPYGWVKIYDQVQTSTSALLFVNAAAVPPGTTVTLDMRSYSGTQAAKTAFSSFTPNINLVVPSSTQFDAPTSLVGSLPGGVPHLAWADNSILEDVFEIEGRDTSVGGAFLFMGEVDFNFTQADIPNLVQAGKTYEIRIRARRWTAAYGNSTAAYTGYSNTVTIAVPGPVAPPPLAPINLTVAANIASSVYSYGLFWDDKSADDTGFEVQEKVTGQPDTQWVTLGVLGAPAGTAEGIGLNLQNNYAAGISRDFRVRAVRGSGAFAVPSTAWSNVATAVEAVFNDPTDMRITAPADNGLVQLFWSDNGTTEEGVELEYRVAGVGNFTSLGTLAQTDYSRYQGGGGIGIFVPSTQVEIRLRAYKGAIESRTYTGYSNVASVVMPPMTAPNNLAAAASSESNINLTWSDNSGNELGYEVQGKLFSEPDSAYTTLLFTAENATTQAISSLFPGTNYSFRVFAVNQLSDSSPLISSAASNVASAATPFNAPSNLQAQAGSITKSQFILNWTDNSLVEHGYDILSRPAGSASQPTFLMERPANAASATIAMSPGESREFFVRAFYLISSPNNYVFSPNSPGLTVTAKDGFTSLPYKSITFGVPFTYQAATTTRFARTAWNITGLPAGLTFNDATGQVTGTPTAAGLFNAVMTASFADGSTDNVTLALRVIHPPGPPVVGAAIGDLTLPNNGNASEISLASKFTDLDADSAVQMQTTLGNVNVILYNTATPQTVANFLAYVNDGRYTDVAFHRAASLGGGGAAANNRDILQGGGYKVSSAPNNFLNVTKFAALANEPGISNVTNTIAMAKIGGLPDSATSEFFFNVKDNASALDNNNGGFSVFGRMASASVAVVATITGLPTIGETTPANELPNIRAYSININGQSSGAAFPDWPMNATPAPPSMDIASVVKINAAIPIPTLAFSFTDNTNPAVVSTAFTATGMVLTPLSLGSSTLTLQATDLDGNTVSQTFTVNVTVPSTNNNLASLVPGAGTLTPAFAPATTSYAVSVPFENTTITFTPTVEDPTATVTVNALPVVSGTPSAAINLNVGDNTINTVVKAQDNSTRTYVVVVNRALSAADIAVEQPLGTDLTDGAATANFGNIMLGANQPLTFTIRNVGVAPLSAIAVTKDGTHAAEFTVSAPGAATVAPAGSTTFTVTFAPGALGARTAAIHIASVDPNENPFDINLTGNGISADLAALVPGAGSLTPVFASGTTSYSLNVPSATTSITVSPTLFDTTATVKVNNVAVASGAASAPVSLNLGANIINTVVTALDGVTTKTYTLTVRRGDLKSQIISPANGSTLASTALALAWNAGLGVTQYYLSVGTTAGGSQIYAASEGTGLSRTVTVPATGAKVYVTLWSLIGGAWQSSTYVYTSQAPVKGLLTGPVNGSTLTDGNLNLTWNLGTGVTSMWVYVGSAVGGYDIISFVPGATTSRTVVVPQDGGPIYVTLWSLINGGWQSQGYWFQTALPAAGSRPARLTSPANTSTLASTSVVFNWDLGDGVSRRDLSVGSTSGGSDLYYGASEAALAQTIALPGDGRRIYVTLWSLIGSTWHSNLYYFTAATAPPPQAAQVTAPANGTALAGASLALTWSAVTGATSHYLSVGSAPMGADLYSGSEGANLTKTVTVPTDGRHVYVTLWSLVSGAWLQNTYWFTTLNNVVGNQKARITTPAVNGSVLPGATATFDWDTGTGVTSYWLSIGTSSGGADLYSAGDAATRSRTLTTLPTDGRKIYVTLWSLISGAWQTNSYFYTAATITPAKAAMTSPAPGTTFASATVIFNWSAGAGASQYWLSVGITPGGSSIYSGGQGTALTRTLTTLPVNGSPIYVTLWSLIGGVWQTNEFIYTAALP